MEFIKKNKILNERRKLLHQCMQKKKLKKNSILNHSISEFHSAAIEFIQFDNVMKAHASA